MWKIYHTIIKKMAGFNSCAIFSPGAFLKQLQFFYIHKNSIKIVQISTISVETSINSVETIINSVEILTKGVVIWTISVDDL